MVATFEQSACIKHWQGGNAICSCIVDADSQDTAKDDHQNIFNRNQQWSNS